MNHLLRKMAKITNDIKVPLSNVGTLLIRYLIVLGVFIYTSSVKAEDSHFYRTSEIERLVTKLLS